MKFIGFLSVTKASVIRMDCFKKQHGKTSIKVSFYIILLGLYIWFYFWPSLEELLSRRTQFSGKMEKVADLPLPTVTLCLKPYFKPSVAKVYGFNSMNSLISDEVVSKPKWNILNDLSYHLGTDFDLEFSVKSINVSDKLYPGYYPWNDTIATGYTSIKPVATLRHGRCYLIVQEYDIDVNSVTYFDYKVSFNKELPESDVPLDYEIFLTSSDGWYGVIMDDWPYFEPTYFTVSTKPKWNHEWVAILVPTRLEFKEGHQEIETCLKEFIDSVNCTNKCAPVFLNSVEGLEQCTNMEDHFCMYDALSTERNIFVACQKPIVTMQYRYLTKPVCYGT